MNNQVQLGEGNGGAARVLIVALDRTLSSVPLGVADLQQRAEAVRAILLKLSILGIDGESLIRYGMAPRAVLPLAATDRGRRYAEALDVEAGCCRTGPDHRGREADERRAG